MGETVQIDLNGTVIQSWSKGERPAILWIKWFDADHVVLDLHGPGIAIISADSWRRCELGYLNELYLSPKFMFATYGDEQFYGSCPGELEGNFISVFVRGGAFEFGVREFMAEDRDAWKLEQVTAGYTFENKFAFLAYDSDLFWVLDVAKRRYTKFPAPPLFWSAAVLSGDGAKAYGICDNRSIRSQFPDRQPFELAVFDLRAERSWGENWTPVDSALIAAGFSLEVKLQRSATGKTIVSENGKAAFLELRDSD